MSLWPEMSSLMPNFNLYQQLFQQFQIYLLSNQILLDSFNIKMQFKYFQQFLMTNQNPLTLQPISKQNQVFQQFLMWRQYQQPFPKTIQGILPRDKITEKLNMRNGESITKVIIVASTGHKVIINASSDTTFEEIFKMYMKKIGLPLESIGKDVMFFVNGAKQDPKSKESIGSTFYIFGHIIVSDLKNNNGA